MWQVEPAGVPLRQLAQELRGNCPQRGRPQVQRLRASTTTFGAHQGKILSFSFRPCAAAQRRMVWLADKLRGGRLRVGPKASS